MRSWVKVWLVGMIVCPIGCLAGRVLQADHEHGASASLAPHSAAQAAQDMAKAANNLLATYTPEQKQTGVFDLTDAERVNWHFIPRVRKGIPFKDLTTAQRPLAHALLSSGLSQRGYASAVTIMSLEQILLEQEQGKGPKRDPENYSVSIFGKPGSQQPWGWRVEGHHLSLNFTIAEGKIVGTPSFFGTNPGEVKDGPRKGLRVLDQEEDLGRALAKSLSEEQKKAGILEGDAPGDIITTNSRKAKLLTPEGIAADQLTAPQKQILLGIISAYANRLRGEVAEDDMQKIQAGGFEKVHFAWAGGLESGQKHYYRVQGPTFLIEYDNTQGNGNHIHSVWRDMSNDFGDDLLKKHYEESHRN